jgi:hypothetical protein
MKPIYLLFIALVFGLVSEGQRLNNIYEDTKQLRSFIDEGPPIILTAAESAKWLSTFTKYYGDSVSDINDLHDALDGNPFGLAAYIPQALLDPNAPVAQALAGPTQAFNAFSAPALAGALTQVIIKRAKEELTATFFQQMKQELKDNPELAVLFPQTSNFIQNIDSYLYAGFLNTLRQAFVQDLTNLNANVKPFLYSSRVKAYIDSHANLRFVYLAIPMSNFVAAISKKEGLANSIRYLYPDPAIKDFNENVYTAMAMFAVVSESVRDATSAKEWISFADFQLKILNDPIAANLFFGLLYESVKDLTINGNSFGTFVTPDNKAGLIAIFKDLLDIYQNVQGGLSAIKAKVDGGKALTADDIEYITSTSLKVLQSVLKDISTFAKLDETAVSQANAILVACQSMLDVAKNISQSNYSSAVMNFLIMSEDLLSVKQNLGIGTTTTASVKANLTTVSVAVENSTIPNKDKIKKQIDKANNKIQSTTATFDAEGLLQKLLKYGSFMAAMAEAKTQDDLTSALDAAILPTGSSSIKHYSSFSISVNSYIGAGYNVERYNSGDPSHVKVSLPTLGVSLPVGVGFNWGFRGNIIGSGSLFISVIDLGAIASFKLNSPDNVSGKSLPDFTWQNLLAPGAYLVLGRILNTPLAIGLGAQKGPQLRSISYDATNGSSINLDDKQVLRFGGFLSVDIPLFNIYSKPWKKPLTD